MAPALRASIALALMVGFYILAIGSGVGLLTIAGLAAATKSAAGFKVAFFCAIAGEAASAANANDRNRILARISPPEILIFCWEAACARRHA